jgi:hypothetical protein
VLGILGAAGWLIFRLTQRNPRRARKRANSPREAPKASAKRPRR